MVGGHSSIIGNGAAALTTVPSVVPSIWCHDFTLTHLTSPHLTYSLTISCKYRLTVLYCCNKPQFLITLLLKMSIFFFKLYLLSVANIKNTKRNKCYLLTFSHSIYRHGFKTNCLHSSTIHMNMYPTVLMSF